MNGCLVVVVDFGSSVCFWNTYVVGTMLQVLELFDELFVGYDFCFTGTEGYLVFTDRFPCNWAARAADDKIRERAEFEQFKRSAFLSFTTKLKTPEGIA